jgi:hypothetical protein
MGSANPARRVRHCARGYFAAAARELLGEEGYDPQ